MVQVEMCPTVVGATVAKSNPLESAAIPGTPFWTRGSLHRLFHEADGDGGG